MKSYAYPAHSQGKSQAGKMTKKPIPSYKRGYKVIDIICEALVIGGVIGSIVGIISYANYRDFQQFRNQTVSSVPTRPEECQPQDNCENPNDSIVYGM